MKLTTGDWIAMAGALMISAGTASFSPAAGLIVLGTLAIVGGVIIDKDRAVAELTDKAKQARRTR